MDGDPPLPPSTASASVALFVDAFARLARALWALPWSVYLTWLGHLIALPFRLLWLPLSYFASFLFILFAPALYIISYLFSWLRVVAAVVVSLEPLYTFFGAAAAVGIISGIALGATSSIITSYLRMRDESGIDKATLALGDDDETPYG